MYVEYRYDNLSASDSVLQGGLAEHLEFSSREITSEVWFQH